MNNFEELLQEEAGHFAEVEERVTKKIKATWDIYQLIGSMIELYVPHFFHCFIDMTSGGPTGEYTPDTPPRPESGSPQSNPNPE